MASQLELLKKHGQGGLMNTDELIFIYPMLVSSSLDKYTPLLREFMMVQYLAQIKISNALHVTSNIAKGTGTARGGTNPAESLYRNLGISGQVEPQQYAQQSDTFAQQQQIDKFRDMLVHLVKTEPRFSELDPIVTTITLDNLLTIPIIAASKKFKLSEDMLYWILFAAAGQKIKLDTTGGIQRVEAVLRHIPKENYLALLDPSLAARAQKDKYSEDAAHDKLMYGDGTNVASLKYFNSLRDKLGKVVSLFSTVLNIDEWNTETGINSTFDTSLSAASISTLGANQTVISSSNGLFASLMSNYVMHLLQSLLHVLVTDTEVDISREIANASKKIIDNSDNVTSGLLMGMMAHIQTQTVESSDSMFKKLSHQCKANSQINISEVLNQLQAVRFSLSSGTSELANFAEMLVSASTKVSPLYDMIVGFIDKTSAGDTINDYLSANNLKAVDIESGSQSNPTGTGVTTDKILELYAMTIAKEITTVFEITGARKKSTRFQMLTGSSSSEKFIETMTSALTNIIKFLTVYTFYSYFCEYTGELAAEVEIKRQDVMDFPNYCLVVPVEIMKTIYGALSADNFKRMIDNPKDFDMDFGEITTTNLNKIVQVLGERLGVRNIIVVDDKAKTVYYKWMYSKQVQRINMGTLKSYVQSQKDFIKAS